MEVLKLLQISFIEKIELVNFDRAIQRITLKTVHLPHLYRLYFISDIDHEDMGLTIQLQPSFKHRLEGFKGNLDTWVSFL